MTSTTSSRLRRLAAPAAIREQFPALARRHRGQPVAYFDGPGGTQVPARVSEAMTDYLLRHNANTHWPYPTSEETDAMIARARAAFGDFFNSQADDVSFGANMTTITLHVGRGLARSWSPGDEVVVTELDHHANVDTWRQLARDRGLVVRTVEMDPGAGTLAWPSLEAAISPRTRLVAVGAASNALGTITDIRRIADLAHDRGALMFVDAVHYAAHVPVDVTAFDCDFLVCSAYKFYGPHLGVLYTRPAIGAAIDVPRLDPAPDSPPERLETGTQNHEGIAGALAAVEFLASLSDAASRREALVATMTGLHERGRELFGRMWNGLTGLRGVSVYGPPPEAPRTPTVSFSVEGHRPDDVARRLADRGVFVSSGDFYAATVIRRLGREPDGVVRAGCACYTTAEEVDRLVEGVAALSRA